MFCLLGTQWCSLCSSMRWLFPCYNTDKCCFVFWLRMVLIVNQHSTDWNEYDFLSDKNNIQHLLGYDVNTWFTVCFYVFRCGGNCSHLFMLWTLGLVGTQPVMCCGGSRMENWRTSDPGWEKVGTRDEQKAFLFTIKHRFDCYTQPFFVSLRSTLRTTLSNIHSCSGTIFSSVRKGFTTRNINGVPDGQMMSITKRNKSHRLASISREPRSRELSVFSHWWSFYRNAGLSSLKRPYWELHFFPFIKMVVVHLVIIYYLWW